MQKCIPNVKAIKQINTSLWLEAVALCIHASHLPAFTWRKDTSVHMGCCLNSSVLSLFLCSQLQYCNCHGQIHTILVYGLAGKKCAAVIRKRSKFWSNWSSQGSLLTLINCARWKGNLSTEINQADPSLSTGRTECELRTVLMAQAFCSFNLFFKVYQLDFHTSNDLQAEMLPLGCLANKWILSVN